MNSSTGRTPILRSIGAGRLRRSATFSRDFLSGGKRFRALFCYWGWQAVVGRFRRDRARGAPARSDRPGLGCERSSCSTPRRSCTTTSSTTPTPAGAPRRRTAASRRCTASSGWAGDAGEFGTVVRASCSATCCSAGATSSSTTDSRRSSDRDRRGARAGRVQPDAHRGDGRPVPRHPRGDAPGRARPSTSTLARAERVIVYKSAKYSVEAPLAIGALARRRRRSPSSTRCAVRPAARHRLPAARRPARRVRRSEVTGKPAATTCARASARCSIALARDGRCRPGARACSTSCSATRTLERAADRAMLQTTDPRACGAVDQVEELIAAQRRRALSRCCRRTAREARAAELRAARRARPRDARADRRTGSVTVRIGSGERLRDAAHLGLAAGAQRLDRAWCRGCPRPRAASRSPRRR